MNSMPHAIVSLGTGNDVDMNDHDEGREAMDGVEEAIRKAMLSIT